MFYHDSPFFTKNKTIQGRYAHSGIRVRPKKKENDKFEKRAVALKNSRPDSKADLPKKSQVWCLGVCIDYVYYDIGQI